MHRINVVSVLWKYIFSYKFIKRVFTYAYVYSAKKNCTGFESLGNCLKFWIGISCILITLIKKRRGVEPQCVMQSFLVPSMNEKID